MANTCHQMCVDHFECAPRVVHRLTLIPLVAGRLWTFFLWTFFLLARQVLRLEYVCLAIGQHIGGSILATTHYPKLMWLFYYMSFLSGVYSWSFGDQKQPDLTISNHRFLSVFLTWAFRHAPSQSQIAHFLLGKSAIFACFWVAHYRITVIFQIFLCKHDLYTCAHLLVL